MPAEGWDLIRKQPRGESAFYLTGAAFTIGGA
jgi:hypothetical protein